MELALTTMLMQAAAAFGNAAVGEAAKRSIGEVWDALKNTVVRKSGTANEVPKLLDDLRAAPEALQAERVAAYLEPLLRSDQEVAAVLENLSRVVQSAAITINAPRADKVYGAQIAYGAMTFNVGKDD
jgi:hypothetical protein